MQKAIKQYKFMTVPILKTDGNQDIGNTLEILADGVGKGGNWTDLPEVHLNGNWFDGIDLVDKVTNNILCGNPFVGACYMDPGPEKVFARGIYNQQKRCFALMNPSRASEGLLLEGWGWDNVATVVTALRSNYDADKAIIYALELAKTWGWQRSETFVKFRIPTKIRTAKTKIQGVILANINSWVEALIAATLESAGYFLITSLNGLAIPACYSYEAFGFRSLWLTDKGNIRSQVNLIAGEIHDAPFIGQCSKPTLLWTRQDNSKKLIVPTIGIRPIKKDTGILPADDGDINHSACLIAGDDWFANRNWVDESYFADKPELTQFCAALPWGDIVDMSNVYGQNVDFSIFDLDDTLLPVYTSFDYADGGVAGAIKDLLNVETDDSLEAVSWLALAK